MSKLVEKQNMPAEGFGGLKRLGHETPEVVSVPIGKADFPAPFVSGLEYSAPARGTWNIVHVGMLIPGAHEIFVCAQGCLRGVVLTAAEMGTADRFSTIAIRQNNVLEGDLEGQIIGGVEDIIQKLPEKPPAILVYTSCIHHFMGCDLELVYRTLREKFPDIDFTDCYMNPIMRKSGLNPDQTMRRQLYSLLKPRKKNLKSVSLVGNDFAFDHTSELYALPVSAGYTVREITTCKTYEDYQAMAESSICITTFPAAAAAGQMLEEKLGQKHLYLPFSFDYKEITENLQRLCEALGIELMDPAEISRRIDACEQALKEARELIGETPVIIDYTAFPRPLSLARLLLGHGFHVTAVYADSFTGDEKEDFEVLSRENPDLLLYPTVHTCMRVAPRENEEKILAVGQKAAYFAGTDYFVNIVEGGGMYGFDGILKLTELMCRAFREPKDARALIQIKGMGCGCCL